MAVRHSRVYRRGVRRETVCGNRNEPTCPCRGAWRSWRGACVYLCPQTRSAGGEKSVYRLFLLGIFHNRPFAADACKLSTYGMATAPLPFACRVYGELCAVFGDGGVYLRSCESYFRLRLYASAVHGDLGRNLPLGVSRLGEHRRVRYHYRRSGRQIPGGQKRGKKQ